MESLLATEYNGSSEVTMWDSGYLWLYHAVIFSLHMKDKWES